MINLKQICRVLKVITYFTLIFILAFSGCVSEKKQEQQGKNES